jgi:cysteine desulfurase family protein (TIGR01976 family)
MVPRPPTATAVWPVERVRARFPALQDHDTVFLDNAAGAQVPARVIDAVVLAMTEMQVNKGGAYARSVRVGEAKEGVRERVRRFLGASDDALVAFGPNATTMVTYLAAAVGRRSEPGDEIVVTGLDHHANVDPWRGLARQGLTVRTWAPRAPEATLDLDDLRALLGPRTRVVALTAASNLLGTRPDVAGAAALAHEVGAMVVVDAVHLAAHVRPDVVALGADALVMSPYKLFGPHLGVLYLAPAARAGLEGPALSFLDPHAPIAWETGTQSHEAIVGFGAVFDYFDDLAGELGITEADDARRWESVMEVAAAYEADLLAPLLRGLDALGARRYGLPGSEGRTATVAFTMPGRDAPRVANELARSGVAVAAGHSYAHDLAMVHLGLAATRGAVRASLVHYSDASDVAALLGALEGIVGS